MDARDLSMGEIIPSGYLKDLDEIPKGGPSKQNLAPLNIGFNIYKINQFIRQKGKTLLA
jgi:hypothetical protein